MHIYIYRTLCLVRSHNHFSLSMCACACVYVRAVCVYTQWRVKTYLHSHGFKVFKQKQGINKCVNFLCRSLPIRRAFFRHSICLCNKSKMKLFGCLCNHLCTASFNIFVCMKSTTSFLSNFWAFEWCENRRGWDHIWTIGRMFQH